MSRTALLLIDWINDLEIPEGPRLLEKALPAARRTATLRTFLKKRDVPVIYANDNFGKWRSDFRKLTEHVLHDDVRGKPLTEILHPADDDYFVLKPMHSAFYSTTMDTLLRDLGVERVVLTGLVSHMCILFTGNDAYMRGLKLVVPRDAIAAADEADHEYALRHCQRVLKAETPTVEEWMKGW